MRSARAFLDGQPPAYIEGDQMNVHVAGLSRSIRFLVGLIQKIQHLQSPPGGFKVT